MPELCLTSAPSLFFWDNASCQCAAAATTTTTRILWRLSEGGQVPTHNRSDPRNWLSNLENALKEQVDAVWFLHPLRSLYKLTTTFCTMSGPKTTWEDLSNLGWFKQQVYDKLNSVRGGTMQGFGDMALNEGFATDYGCAILHIQVLRL